MKIICVDLFCGAGGTSPGLVEAAEELGITVDLLAINHWDLAIATHSANHPRARQICAKIGVLGKLFRVDESICLSRLPNVRTSR